jgi:hypothetical protein
MSHVVVEVLTSNSYPTYKMLKVNTFDSWLVWN